MDNTLVDFSSGLARMPDALARDFVGHEDDIPGVFGLMDPMPGAIDSFHALSEVYDTYILSTAPWHNPTAWSDKIGWVQRYLGVDADGPAYKRLILSHHKHLNRGEFLVDDRPGHNGADRFEGELIAFGSAEFPDWDSVSAYLLDRA
ncbi:hypothetical protein AB2L57_09035 [Microbacterium sp. HA-8]|uniref:5' nucleotidase, NT5C type n=1 Tax=Microbacterium sp. HA-8 TaxID=3234200 RepID=UPI0038F6249F